MTQLVPTAALHEVCNAQAIAIWKAHADQHRTLPGMHLMPMVRGAFRIAPQLLIVGMNPSMVHDEEPDDSSGLTAAKPGRRVPDELRWESTRDDAALKANVASLVAQEEKAPLEYPRYYKPLQDFAKEVGAEPEYLDMFLMRHTRQSEVLSKHWKAEVFAPPARELFDLFKQALKAISPRVVLIANAGASNIARKLLPLTTQDKLVYRWDQMPNARFILSGMLSGQRALDTFSRERLAHDVKAALSQEVAA
ncbi:hypothetical protein [Rhizobacter fulvus]